MPLFNSNIPPIQQQQNYLLQMNNINGNNATTLQDFDYQQQHLSPLLMQQQQQVMMYSNNDRISSSSATRKFNVNATRSNSSSSSNSSVLSALRTTNNISSLSSSPGSNIGNNTFGKHYDLLNIKNRNKLFEDDVLFCPRALLSQSELKTRDELDKFLMDRYNEYMIFNGQQQQLHIDEKKNSNNGSINNGPKFNPYASKSFTPGN